MNSFRLCSLISLSALLAACASPRTPAPITERGPAPPPVASRPAEPAPAARPTPVRGSRETDGRGYYTVKRGDTLIHIALEFGQNYRDLISWNNLANPNDIKVDQVLRVSPPDGAAVTSPVVPGTVTEAKPGSVTPGPASTAPVAGSGPVKVSPRGDKRQYSDAALAELQKPDGAPGTPAASVPPPVVRVEPAIRPPEKPADGNADDEAVSWTWPAQGKLAGPFDDARRGIDIMGTAGQDVVAAAAGKVSYANHIRGYGNLVIIKHTNNLLSAYAHNKTILVKENQTVTKGQKIAEMGNSDSDAVKLHFEIRQQGKPVDPAKFLPGR